MNIDDIICKLKQSSNFFSLKHYLVIFICTVLCWSLTFINDNFIFYFQSSSVNIDFEFYWFCKAIIFFVLWYICEKLANIDFHTSEAKQRLEIFCIYFFVMLALLLACWPGIWRWDEIITLGCVTNGQAYYWQHWISSVYTFCLLQIIPIPGGVVLVQLIIISFIVEESIWIIYKNIKSKVAYLMFLPLLLPAVLDSNLYPIRATMCGYIELYVIFQVLGILKYDESCNLKKVLLLSILSGILSSWRPENIIYVLGIIVALQFIDRIEVRYLIVFGIVSSLIVFSCAKIQNDGLSKKVFTQNSAGGVTTEKEAYSLSGFITGLADITAAGEFRTDEKKKDVEFLKECFYGDSFFYQSGMKTFWTQQLNSIDSDKLLSLKKLYVKLIVYNPAKFIKKRIDMFIDTNFSYKKYNCSKASSHIFDDFNLDNEQDRNIAPMYTEFRNRYLYNTPISKEIRSNTINYLEGKENDDYERNSSKMVNVFWNIVPILIGLMFVVFCASKDRDWCLLTLLICVVTKVIIVFLTAPIPLFMYYFSTYIIGGELLMLLFIRYIIERSRDGFCKI